MNTNCGVYLILNTAKNKVYVGSSKNLKRRKYEYFRDLSLGNHCNSYLQNAYNKYGKDSFRFIEVEYCKEEELTKKEVEWIIFKKSNQSCFGYNLANPDRQFGKNGSEEFKENVRRKTYFYHYPNHTEENYQEWKELKRLKSLQPKITLNKKVYAICPETGRILNIFNSIAETARYFNSKEKLVVRYIDKQQKIYNGINQKMFKNVYLSFSFNVNKDYKKKTPPPKIKIKKPRPERLTMFIDLYKDGIFVERLRKKEFVEKYNAKMKGIDKALSGERKRYKGFEIKRTNTSPQPQINSPRL
jgi:group I intron endonuclease